MPSLRTQHDITPRSTLNSEDPAAYLVGRPDRAAENEIITRAIDILRRRIYNDGVILSDPSAVRDYLVLTCANLEHEVFGCIWITSQHQVLADEILFTGTLSQTSVYPREVVKSALQHNAGAVIFFHNHPSGFGDPSSADERLTSELKRALALVDVRVLDHFIVAGTARPTSFAERGLI